MEILSPLLILYLTWPLPMAKRTPLPNQHPAASRSSLVLEHLTDMAATVQSFSQQTMKARSFFCSFK